MMKLKTGMISILMLSVVIVCAAPAQNALDLGALGHGRPAGGNLVQDLTGELANSVDYTNRYLQSIRDQYGIEAMIVAVPSCGEGQAIEELAVQLMEEWQIGRAFNGRGLLLLFVKQDKQVKMEVSRELEDVFTDAFTGYIEDKQLKNYYLAGDVGTGLIAVMEEIEKRSRLKFSGDYDAQRIARLDNESISQGAGARRDLTRYQEEEVARVGDHYPAGATPDEAWQTIIRSYRDKARDANLGVYTAVTRRAYADYQNLSDSYYEEEFNKYVNKPYEILQEGDYAVVFFGNKKGWDNSPFLLCNNGNGWQFDIVHQRKFIRMGPNPAWGAERGDHPYARLLSRAPYWTGQDIPLEGEDRYDIGKDEEIVGEIVEAEAAYRDRPDDFDTALRLGRLYTVAAFSRQAIPVLNKALQLDPSNPLPLKYLAIAHVDAFYQYGQAIAALETYVAQVPDDVFGRNFLGYLYLHEGKLDPAIAQLEKAIDLNGDNVYAYCKLSEAYAEKYLKSSAVDVFRDEYRKKSLAAYEQAQNVITPNATRVGWLRDWLEEEGLLNAQAGGEKTMSTEEQVGIFTGVLIGVIILGIIIFIKKKKT